MRVLALVTDAFGGHGGIAQYNRDFLTALSRSGRVAAVTALPRLGTPSSTMPAGLMQLPAYPNRVAWSAQAVRYALQTRPDVIFCGHLNAAPLAAAIGMAIARPVWLQVHGIEAWSDRSSFIRRAVAASRLVTSVSRHTRHRLLSWSGVPPDRVRVLPNTLTAVQGVSTKRQDLVIQHNLRGRKVILTVGRMSAAEAYKGHDRIIRCLAGVKRLIPEIAYLVVGSGDDRPRLEALALEQGVADITQFVGAVPAEDLSDYYGLADVFAMPSTGEGFGIVFLEAARSGLVVIGGNCDGSVDALAEGRIGRAVDPASPSSLTGALIDALEGRLAPAPAEVERFAFDAFARHVDALAASLDERLSA